MAKNGPIPFVNKHIATIKELDDIIDQRCAALAQERDAIKSRAGFHWWPKIVAPNDQSETV